MLRHLGIALAHPTPQQTNVIILELNQACELDGKNNFGDGWASEVGQIWSALNGHFSTLARNSSLESLTGKAPFRSGEAKSATGGGQVGLSCCPGASTISNVTKSFSPMLLDPWGRRVVICYHMWL